MSISRLCGHPWGGGYTGENTTKLEEEEGFKQHGTQWFVQHSAPLKDGVTGMATGCGVRVSIHCGQRLCDFGQILCLFWALSSSAKCNNN